MTSAAQSAINAASSNQSSDSPQQSGRDSQTSSSEPNSQGADSNAANGPVPERAKQALLQRIALVKDGFQGDDCTCFDTTIGCGLTVSVRNSVQSVCLSLLVHGLCVSICVYISSLSVCLCLAVSFTRRITCEHITPVLLTSAADWPLACCGCCKAHALHAPYIRTSFVRRCTMIVNSTC